MHLVNMMLTIRASGRKLAAAIIQTLQTVGVAPVMTSFQPSLLRPCLTMCAAYRLRVELSILWLPSIPLFICTKEAVPGSNLSSTMEGFDLYQNIGSCSVDSYHHRRPPLPPPQTT